MKQISGLRQALLQAGITCQSSQADVEKATRAYWKAYHQAYGKKRKKRAGKRVAVQVTDEEYEQLKMLAKERGRTKGFGVIFKDAVFGATLGNCNPEISKNIETHLRQAKNDINKVVQKIQMKIRFSPQNDDSATFLSLKSDYVDLLQRIEVLEQVIQEFIHK